MFSCVNLTLLLLWERKVKGKTMSTPARNRSTSRNSVAGNEQVKADTSVGRNKSVDKLIRHVNSSENYSFDSVCKSISDAVNKAKVKA